MGLALLMSTYTFAQNGAGEILTAPTSTTPLHFG
jgi:hypothetical protein